MDPQVIVPVVLFASIAYMVKVIVEAYLRKRMVEVVGSSQVLATLFEAEARHRRTASLRWGIVLTALAVAFGAIEIAGWREVTPGAIAVLLAATGLGHLAYYVLAQRLQPASVVPGSADAAGGERKPLE